MIRLGEWEMEEVIEEEGEGEVVCELCNEGYDFNKEEVESIVEEGKK